jgi:hypothetical protein
MSASTDHQNCLLHARRSPTNAIRSDLIRFPFAGPPLDSPFLPSPVEYQLFNPRMALVLPTKACPFAL